MKQVETSGLVTNPPHSTEDAERNRSVKGNLINIHLVEFDTKRDPNMLDYSSSN